MPLGYDIAAGAANLLMPGTPVSSFVSGIADYQRQKADTAEERAYNATMTREGWAHSAEEAQKDRDWQESLANTAHQREVADLEAAGLNKWLSAGGGGAPVGATSVGGDTSAHKAGGHPQVNIFMNADRENNKNIASAAKIVSSLAG